MLRLCLTTFCALIFMSYGAEEVTPAYEIRDDGIFLFLKISNEQEHDKTIRYDKNSVISFSLKCKEKDVAGIHYTQPNLDCEEYHNNPSSFENYSDAQLKKVEKICGGKLANQDVIPSKSTKNIFIQRLRYKANYCDSLKVDLDLNYSKVEY